MGSKAPAPPPPPDYAGLANQQAQLSQQAIDKNRVDQVNPYGTLTWSKDPATGRWTQTESLNPDAAATLKAEQQAQLALANTGQGLLGRATGAVSQPFSLDGKTQIPGLDIPQDPTVGLPGYKDVSTEGLQDYGSLDLSQLGAMPDAGFGAVQQVSDAMMSRLRPDLDRGRDAEIQRLKAQGITEGTPAWQRAMEVLGRKDTDASMQSLLAGTQAYGDIFNRGMAVRKQGMNEATTAADFSNDLRGRQLAERMGLADYSNAIRSALLGENIGKYNRSLQASELMRGTARDDRTRQIEEELMMRQMPLNEFNAFMSGAQIQNPRFSGPTTLGAGAADMYGANQSSYEAALADYNAAQAYKSNKKTGMIGGAASGAATGATFGPWGAVAGGLIGGFLGSR